MALGGVKGAEVNKSLGRARETFTVQAEKELRFLHATKAIGSLETPHHLPWLSECPWFLLSRSWLQF